MRIISGKNKGQRLTAPKKLPVRPTTDMAKEALFNILNNQYHFNEVSVLDLFAGTGNISYEFASRGSENITAVDADFGCIKFITATSSELDFPITTIKKDVFQYLQANPIKAHIIFADPPYDLSPEEFATIPKLVFERQLLLENGVLIVEHSKHSDLSHLEHFTHQRRYGGSVFSFFEWMEE
ncbi:RsmD family RNA methyltransferase [Arenibacter sp. ARW7G5Y1]|uniref:RsmD family RNA methyltransferase n=1 Tax=Arenibacter sp. ARW7G5Y1 TaxID=2135619 RepID=UPI000D770323|nr:RsmD family RNA methyltransferase [Arenibacter sp. ARW7G5Y1]PXX22666.1 16S rRNA (guanine(966)-N(2))-methyltransferase RsmD [Arenibacter sp. ARW7G5Y1]